MLFSSVPFLYFFLPVLLILYLITPNKFKNILLLLANLIFYAWGEKLLVLLFILSMMLGWGLGLLIGCAKNKTLSKFFLFLSISINLGLLGYFKYVDFFIENFNAVTGFSIPLLKIALPIGISFYTFQILSYTVDVYRKIVPAQKNIISFSLYVSLFPQLIAGPIVRYSDVEKQLKNHPMSLDKTADGTRRFLIGLGKKVLLSNPLGELCVLFRQTDDPSVLYCWLYAVGFMLQIYFDFSGYSDMAIGLGKLFGFSFAENFRYPYISGSITEFWRRWHISLGTWFRDYVYIPLGGNRCGTAKQIRNIFIVWLLTGFWHGAAWNFILWGLLYALLLLVEKLWIRKFLESHTVTAHIYVLLSVLLGFVLFNAPDLSYAVSDIKDMFGMGGIPIVSTEAIYRLHSYGMLLIIAILGCTPLPVIAVRKISDSRFGGMVLQISEPFFLTAILFVTTAYLVDGSFNPFLYFRF